MEFCYEYPRPALTVDAVVLRNAVSVPEILLIRRKHPPFGGNWALPGGFVNEEEDLLDAAIRELFEESGIKMSEMTQFRTYGNPKRDPRHRTVTVVYIAWLDTNDLPVAGDDAAEAKWFALDQLPEMAFDHAGIISDVVSQEKISL